MSDQTANIIIAILSFIGGGLGAELVRRWFGWGERKLGDAAKVREQLLAEIQSLRTELRTTREKHDREIHKLRVEVDGWQERYYGLVTEAAQAKAENELLKQKVTVLENELADLRTRFGLMNGIKEA